MLRPPFMFENLNAENNDLKRFVSHNFMKLDLRKDTFYAVLVLTIKGMFQYEIENNRISTT